ncbi:MAG: flippase-like domain-containing protein [Anaerolineales bacterium]|nr:flippase-like domain-containing protein [Anaerolineales bacterium]MCB9128417.1 flippase-like domain-containing protein [Ardenticatenales bacterium]
MNRDRAMTVLKVGVSLGLIVWLFRDVDLNEVWAALRRTDLLLFVVAMVLYMGAIASNAVKWGVLLRAQGVKPPLSALVRHTFVGVFFTNFLTFLGGDMMRGYGLVREIERIADVAVSVLVDRMIGLLAFATAGTFSAVVAVRFFGMDESALLVVEQIGIAATLALLVGFALLLSGRLRRWMQRGMGRLPLLKAVMPIVEQLSNAVGYYRSRPLALVAAYGVGLSTILISNLVNWLLFIAIGDTAIQLLHIFIFNPIVGLTQALPISVGGLGVNQAMFPYLYGLVGVSKLNALAASLLLQMIIYLTSLPGGLFWLLRRATTKQSTQNAERRTQNG